MRVRAAEIGPAGRRRQVRPGASQQLPAVKARHQAVGISRTAFHPVARGQTWSGGPGRGGTGSGKAGGRAGQAGGRGAWAANRGHPAQPGGCGPAPARTRRPAQHTQVLQQAEQLAHAPRDRAGNRPVGPERRTGRRAQPLGDLGRDRSGPLKNASYSAGETPSPKANSKTCSRSVSVSPLHSGLSVSRRWGERVAASGQKAGLPETVCSCEEETVVTLLHLQRPRFRGAPRGPPGRGPLCPRPGVGAGGASARALVGPQKPGR
ncbi:hypothetical protein SAMN04488058_11726 [Deinococcus reticulitermitis]|uniref:Uncharacterized protein n=1 Tax=Deinococcus reticulitermitis TaxID=856736 RepID=A0A1H7BDI9_9DEIO|nr:hypothetical protein SAMN04488058_11726 [Deinococcus reticulitermitis]